MTTRQAARKLRSLYHRQRLIADLAVLEREVIEFVEETGMKALAGFKVEVVRGHVRLTKVQVNSEQLNFDFIKEEL